MNAIFINLNILIMNPLETFIENYKNATKELTMVPKIIVTIVVSFIFIAVIFAILGVIPDILG